MAHTRAPGRQVAKLKRPESSLLSNSAEPEGARAAFHRPAPVEVARAFQFPVADPTRQARAGTWSG